MKIRNKAYLPVSGELIRELFVLPQGLEISGGYYDYNKDEFKFLVNDKTKKIIPGTEEGQVLPIMIPHFFKESDSSGFTTAIGIDNVEFVIDKYISTEYKEHQIRSSKTTEQIVREIQAAIDSSIKKDESEE